MSSSSRRRRRTEMERPPPAPAARAEERDWAALPRDVLLDVFLKLGPRKVMLGAEHTCTAWRRAAIEEPTLWRRVGMGGPLADEAWRNCWDAGVEMAMKLTAVGRAAGQCEAFCGACDGDDLLDLVQRTPNLKSLAVEYFSMDDSGELLAKALKKLPLLEDLQIEFPWRFDWDKNMTQSVCQACPYLRQLILMRVHFNLESNEDEFPKEPIVGEIPMMRDLRTLVLSCCRFSCEDLKAILDSCPILETLHIIRGSYFHNPNVYEELRIKYTRVKNWLTLGADYSVH